MRIPPSNRILAATTFFLIWIRLFCGQKTCHRKTLRISLPRPLGAPWAGQGLPSLRRCRQASSSIFGGEESESPRSRSACPGGGTRSGSQARCPLHLASSLCTVGPDPRGSSCRAAVKTGPQREEKRGKPCWEVRVRVTGRASLRRYPQLGSHSASDSSWLGFSCPALEAQGNSEE